MTNAAWYDAKQAARTDAAALDGLCLIGTRGCLRVVLQPATLARLPKRGGATHWLIPLDDGAMVRLAATLPGEVLWLSRRPPAESVGRLDDGMRGAWREGSTAVVNLDGRVVRVPLADTSDAADALTSLVPVVARMWSGDSPAATPARASVAAPRAPTVQPLAA